MGQLDKDEVFEFLKEIDSLYHYQDKRRDNFNMSEL